MAKLIVTGKDREEALQRSRRALAEFNVDGIATALTFHRVVVNDPAFAPADPQTPFTVHTRWIETEFKNEIPAYSGDSHEIDESSARQSVVVEVNGKRLEVTLPHGFGAQSSEPTPTAKKREHKKASANASGDALTAPMQGTIVKIDVSEGQEVAAGDLIVVLEAMKMEMAIRSPRDGSIRSISVSRGDPVVAGSMLVELDPQQEPE